jgi:diaminopimelate epimerase
VAVAAARRDGADPETTGEASTYTVDVPGGRLVITESPGGEIEMTGPAVIVAEGEIDEEWLRAAGA